MKQGTTTFLLIRHGAHILGGGTIPGRLERAVLSELGRAQATRMADRIAQSGATLAAIYASPVVRAQQTAGPLAERLGLPIQTADALAEIDYGDWTGRALDELRALEGWTQWNAC